MPTIPNALVPIFFCWHHPCSQISRFQGVATTTLYFRCRLCTKSLSRYQFMKFFVVSSNLKKVLITQMAVMCLAGHPGFPGKKVNRF